MFDKNLLLKRTGCMAELVGRMSASSILIAQTLGLKEKVGHREPCLAQVVHFQSQPQAYHLPLETGGQEQKRLVSP